MKLDILAFGAHPDDVELSASGTLLSHASKGYKTGIVDLTAGELGTRGNAGLRLQEAKKSASVLQLSGRENLQMADGFFEDSRESMMKIVSAIRKFRPEIILCNAVTDRHPDHGRAGAMVEKASFLAGLVKVEDDYEAWRVKAVYHYIQDRYIVPDFVVDISEWWPKKLESILAFSSQFYNPDSKEPATAISSKEFLEFLESRARDMGRQAGFRYAEGFTAARYPGVKDLFSLL